MKDVITKTEFDTSFDNVWHGICIVDKSEASHNSPIGTAYYDDFLENMYVMCEEGFVQLSGEVPYINFNQHVNFNQHFCKGCGAPTINNKCNYCSN